MWVMRVGFSIFVFSGLKWNIRASSQCYWPLSHSVWVRCHLHAIARSYESHDKDGVYQGTFLIKNCPSKLVSRVKCGGALAGSVARCPLRGREKINGKPRINITWHLNPRLDSKQQPDLIGTSALPQRPCSCTPTAPLVAKKCNLKCSLTPAQFPSFSPPLSKQQ